jgi:hypothetical protein
MRERAASIGATLTVTSVVGSGTEVRMIVSPRSVKRPWFPFGRSGDSRTSRASF